MPHLSNTMRVSSATVHILLLLLCANDATSFAPSSTKSINNDRRHVLEAQSTLNKVAFDGIVQELPTSPPSATCTPTLRGDVSTERRLEWLASASSKAVPLTREMLAAKRKMIEDKHTWEAQKELEVKSRVAMLRERNAARQGSQAKPTTSLQVAGSSFEHQRPEPQVSSKSVPSPWISAARQRVEEKTQLAKWEANKNVEVKSRISILRERNARLAQERAMQTDDSVPLSTSPEKVEAVKKVVSKSNVSSESSKDVTKKSPAMPDAIIPKAKQVALESAISEATADIMAKDPYEAMDWPDSDSFSP